MKKYLLRAALILLSVQTVHAFDFEYDGVAYNIIDDGSVEVTFMPDGSKYKGNVSIPDVIILGDNPDEPMATGSGVSVDNDNSDERIVYDVVKIGDYAFKDCVGLTRLEMPAVIREIGVQAIAGCTGLSEIIMPDALEKINDEAFMASSFKSMSIYGGLYEIGNRVFYGVNADDIQLRFCKLTEFGEEIFANSSIRRIILPSGLLSIPPKTFMGCVNLEYVELNRSLEEIGENAFSGCKSLTSLSLPENIRTIGENAFSGAGIKKISFIRNEAPEYNAGALFADEMPLLVALPSEAVRAYQEWCPDLLQDKVRYKIGDDCSSVYWASNVIPDQNTFSDVIPEGVTLNSFEPSEIFIKPGEDLSIAFGLFCGGPGYKYYGDGKELAHEEIFIGLDNFYDVCFVSFISDSWLFAFKNVEQDCAISLVPDGSGVQAITATGISINYNPLEKIISSEDGVINLYDIAGKRIACGYGLMDISNLADGVYIIKTSRDSKKICVGR